MFKVISVKGPSVRIRTGCVTFDVLVSERNGKLMITKPAGIYVLDGHFDEMVSAAVSAYKIVTRSEK